jgi:hypothetical protein
VIGRRPVLVFVLRNGQVVTAQVAQGWRRAREEIRAGLTPFAPASVEWIPDSYPSMGMGRCPRCGKNMLAPDVDVSGFRHCWNCGEDVPDEKPGAVAAI